jgi:hypothetical protein
MLTIGKNKEKVVTSIYCADMHSAERLHLTLHGYRYCLSPPIDGTEKGEPFTDCPLDIGSDLTSAQMKYKLGVSSGFIQFSLISRNSSGEAPASRSALPLLAAQWA